MTRTVLSRSCVRTAPVPSSLPSSTTTISRSTGSSTDRIRRTISATVLRSLKTGTMIDSVRNRGSAVSSLMPSSLTLSPEPLGGAGETFAEVDLRAPAEHVGRKRDVRPAACRIVDGQRLEHDLGARSRDLEHRVGEVQHGELVRVPDVHRTGPVGVEEGEDATYLVVDAARTDRVDVTPVPLVLRVDLGVAVDLARRRKEVPGAGGLGEAEGVVGAERADLQGLDRVLEVVAGARGAGEVQDGVHATVD